MRATERVIRRAGHNLTAEATGSSEVKLLITELLVGRHVQLKLSALRSTGAASDDHRLARRRRHGVGNNSIAKSFVGATSRSIRVCRFSLPSPFGQQRHPTNLR